MKSYLKYSLTESFGVIASSQSNAVFDLSGNLAITAGLQQVGVWNLKQGTLVRNLRPEGDERIVWKGEVSYISASPDGNSVAAGYTSGLIRIFKISDGSMSISFNGHKTSVNVCRYNSSGDRLVSGGADTDLVIWDIVAEKGECRLKGHRDGITDAMFLGKNCALYPGLVSSSKDSLVKIWDLETQHCIQTIVGHRGEVWSLDLNPDGKRLVTSSSDLQLRMWSIKQMEDEEPVSKSEETEENLIAIYMGSILLSLNGGRAGRVRFHVSGDFLAIQGGKKSHVIELFKVRSIELAIKKRTRRLKRHKEKIDKKKKQLLNETEDNQVTEDATEKIESSRDFVATDELESIGVITCTEKVRSFDFSPMTSHHSNIHLLVALQSNSLESWKVSQRISSKDGKNDFSFNRLYELNIHGHRSEIRATAISADSSLLASVGKSEAKLWSSRNLQCVKTTLIGVGISCAFAPGDKHLIVGTKDGHLLLIDLAVGDVIQDIECHKGPIWSIDVSPDKSGMISGSADGQVKIWEFELSEGNLNVVHTRTLQMADDVLCVRYSKHKFKLPVMSMDITDDGAIIATGSADKTLKLWGLDFGDCHRSLFGHSDSITGVKFLPRTHLLFTIGKDKLLVMWDADRFEKIIVMEGHQAEIWALSVCNEGSFFVTAGHDKSIKLWERTDEMIFVEEEKEKELERIFEAELDDDDKVEAETKVTSNEEESGVPGRRGFNSVLAGERLIEALELVVKHGEEARKVERARRKAIKRGLPPPKMINQDPLLLGMAPDDRFLNELMRVKAADLEQAILVLPFSHVSISSGPASLALTLESLRTNIRNRVKEARDMVGNNIAGMKLLRQKIDESKNSFSRNGYIMDETYSTLSKKRK